MKPIVCDMMGDLDPWTSLPDTVIELLWGRVFEDEHPINAHGNEEEARLFKVVRGPVSVPNALDVYSPTQLSRSVMMSQPAGPMALLLPQPVGFRPNSKYENSYRLKNVHHLPRWCLVGMIKHA
jgi:hypothetical protein